MERKFKVGDVVRLKSDSIDNVEMTVDGYKPDKTPSVRLAVEAVGQHVLYEVCCVWRDKDDKPQEKYYHEDALIFVR